MAKKSLLAVFAAIAAIGPATAEAPSTIDPLFAADQGETRAVLMIRDGKVAAKRYAPGYSDANRFISWSMAKSVTSVLIGELVSDGRLALDEPAPIAEWHGQGDPRAAITLRELLHMSSGLEHTEIGEVLQKSDTNRALFVDGTEAMAKFAIAKPLEAVPGSKYEYSSLTSIILAEIITRTLTPSEDPRERAQAYRSFAEERLFGPAGIRTAVLEFDGAGTQIGGSIIYMSLDDWGRFGLVLKDGKGPDGAEIITPYWMQFMRTPAPTDGGYGGHIWLNRPRPKGSEPALFPGKGPPTLVSAIGHLGQYVIASPDQDLVLVRLGKTQDDKLDPVRQALGRVVAAIPVKQP